MLSPALKNALSSCRELVDDELSRLFVLKGGSIYPRLREAMYYSLEAGGKRLRPCLVLMVCEMLGGRKEKALPIACGLEMIHTYSLIHDDMPGMDNDDMRRGRPSNHKVFGEGMALLAGDALLSFAFETMLASAMDPPDPDLLKAVYTITALSGAAGMLTGQASDKENENSPVRTGEMLDYIHSHKTSDMLKAAVLSGAHCAGADEKIVRALELYSEKMGLLFQITDDLLDVTGDPSMMGKTLGKDAEEGKLTFVSLYGVEGAEAKAEEAASEAKSALASVSGAELLSDLIDYLLTRRQ